MGKTYTVCSGMVLRFEVCQGKARESYETISCRCLDRDELAHVVVCPVSSWIPAGDVGVLALEALKAQPLIPKDRRHISTAATNLPLEPVRYRRGKEDSFLPASPQNMFAGPRVTLRFLPS